MVTLFAPGVNVTAATAVPADRSTMQSQRVHFMATMDPNTALGTTSGSSNSAALAAGAAALFLQVSVRLLFNSGQVGGLCGHDTALLSYVRTSHQRVVELAPTERRTRAWAAAVRLPSSVSRSRFSARTLLRKSLWGSCGGLMRKRNRG